MSPKERMVARNCSPVALDSFFEFMTNNVT